MSVPETPQNRRPAPRPPGWAVIAVFAGVFAALAFGLAWLFPERHLEDGAYYYILGMSVVVALVLAGVFAHGIDWGEAARNVAIWAGIVGALAALYTASSGFSQFQARMLSAILPGTPVPADGHVLVLSADNSDDFVVTGKVDGTPILFSVDTGATSIVLSPDDARRAGFDLSALRFVGRAETANGEGRFAFARVGRLEVGPIHFENVEVQINAAPMSTSLLGMSFLKRLKSFQFAGRTLTLTWN